MYAEDVGPAETVLVGEIRSLVGPRLPLACTFDLHGNIPARLARFGDILVGLKTAPHTDGAQTAELAGQILLDTLPGKVHPVSYVLPIPMILQGEKAMTTAEPFRSLVEEARRQFSFGCETAELAEGVTRALEAREPTVFLTDSGDNVTASTPGDLPLVLRHLVERKVESAVVAGLNDRAATAQCFEAGEGKKLRVLPGAGGFLPVRPPSPGPAPGHGCQPCLGLFPKRLPGYPPASREKRFTIN